MKSKPPAPGKPGYRELVNFEERIGYYVNPIGTEKIETSWGVIHYSKGGVHIIPAKPPFTDGREFETHELLTNTLLALQNALNGSIAPSLRAVCVNVNAQNGTLFLSFFYDGEITEPLFDLASVASSEVFSRLPEFNLEENIERVDYPNPIPASGTFAYHRKEKRVSENPPSATPSSDAKDTLSQAPVHSLQKALRKAWSFVSRRS